MKYIIKGNLSGYLCEDCKEPLTGMEVLLYLPWQDEKLLKKTVASVKETFHMVVREEADDRKALMLDKCICDEKGNFEFVLDEQYANSAFDIDFVCTTVPSKAQLPEGKGPVQIHVTTLFPQWRIDKNQENYYFQWEYTVSAKWWCFVRGYYFDAWVLCGHLLHAETGAPIVNANVEAWDADFLTDDNLGSCYTDHAGYFRIDYSSIRFKQTFLSPLVNVETDEDIPVTFQSGPDVYFKASIGNVNLVDETSADRRPDVGYCLCVDLSSKINVVNPGDPDFPSAWTGIGTEFDIVAGNASRAFDADGFAGEGKYALSGTIRLTGQAAIKSASGNPIEYRFLVSKQTTPNGGTAPSDESFNMPVGVTPGLFVSGTVARLVERNFPYKTYDVMSAQTDFDAEGWFDINTAINRTVANNKLGDINNYLFIDTDTLISLDTRVLTSNASVSSASVNAGDSIPALNKMPVEKMALRFEIREVVNKSARLFSAISGSGKTLNAVVINNTPIVMKLAVTELDTTGMCAPIGGKLHAKYTVYHPYLKSVLLNLNNSDGSVNKEISGDGFLPLLNNSNNAIDGNANSKLLLNKAPVKLAPCTYSLKLKAQARLHNGDSASPFADPEEILFYYNG